MRLECLESQGHQKLPRQLIPSVWFFGFGVSIDKGFATVVMRCWPASSRGSMKRQVQIGSMFNVDVDSDEMWTFLRDCRIEERRAAPTI